jgi:ABC-2 type transport system permease protein
MHRIWIITKREIQFNLDSLIAYIALAGFLLFTGGFTWLSQFSNVFAIKQADLTVFFDVSRWTLFFFIPALTMRMLAEERKSGTIELLLTRPVSYWEIILGKFLSCWMLVGLALLLTMPYYLTVAYLGNIDHAATIAGYLGLMLMSAAYIALGLLAGSFTDNQIVALLLALLMGIFFQLIFELIGAFSPGLLGEVFYYLSMNKHLESLSRGVFDVRDGCYFLSLTYLGLLLTVASFSKRA